MREYEALPIRHGRRCVFDDAAERTVEETASIQSVWDSARVIHIRRERHPDSLRDGAARAKDAYYHRQRRESGGHQNIVSSSIHISLLLNLQFV
jgi:hypothetical protein